MGEIVTQFVIVVAVCCGGMLLLRAMIKLATRLRAVIRAKLQPKKRSKDDKVDPWQAKNGYSWDYVFVVKVLEASEPVSPFQKNFSLKSLIQRISQAGLEPSMVFSSKRTHVFVKVRCPLDRLKAEADRVNLKLPLDEMEVARRCVMGKTDVEGGRHVWKPFQIPEADPLIRRMCKFGPYQHLYYKYNSTNEEQQPLYKRHRATKSIFRSVDRIKLIVSILKAAEANGGCAMDPSELMLKKAVVAAFPLHDADSLQAADKAVLNFCQMPWRLDVGALRDYFGEKVAFYFLFLEHYTTWLIVPAILGVFVWIDVASKNDFDAPSIPFLCFFVAIWATLYLEFWKRKQVTHAMLWGTTDFRVEEQTRPHFSGKPATDPVTGKKTLFFPESEMYYRMAFSQTTILGLILVVISVVSSIFALKWFLLKSPQDEKVAIDGAPLGGFIASLANAVQIQVTNHIYQGVAIWLTELENHRTETSFEDSLIAKTFMFQFVNSYASLFYIAFVKAAVEGCAVNCMAELSTSLGTIFVTRIVVGNLQEVLVPYISFLLEKRRSKRDNKGQDISPVEVQFLQSHYDVMLGPFSDYLELIIQYGYSTLFVAAFPLALVASFINNYIEIRVDGWKLCQQSRRPEPRGAEDIGTWYVILEIMSTIAVICNLAIIFFTGRRFDRFSLYERCVMFIVAEHLVLSLKHAFALFIPDVPQGVEIQLKRKEFITSKVFENLPDDDDDDGFEVNRTTMVDLNVSLNDED